MSHVTFSFKGFIVPVLTPFNDDSSRSLNLSVIPRYAEFLMKKGIKGVLVNGTSGEGMSMSVAERKIVAESWANAVKSTKQHLMIQVGGAPLPDVLELAKHAQSIGADSMLCLPELYFKPTVPQQLVKYLTLVSKAAPHTPLLYYHIPMFTNVNINMAQFLDSIGDKIPSFVGIKFTSTNLEEGAQALHIRNDKFVIFLGSDQIVAAAIAIGMDSFIATSINLLPELALEILQAGIKGEGLKARERQEKLSKAVMAISKYGTWVETMKAAMTLLTPINVGPPRAPLTPLPAESITAMTSGLKNLGYNIYT